jgi:Ran GTPase-activating protein (RanGAP) involved in mRNA processing and transport
MAELLASFVSSFVSSKVEKLSVQELKDFFRGKINEEVIQNLKMSWCSISAVLSDAEEK